MTKGKGRGGARPVAMIVERNDRSGMHGEDELAAALRGDLEETLSLLRLALPRAGDTGLAERFIELSDGDAPLIVTFSDVAALPLLSVEGALELLEEVDCAAGACGDGALYLLALAPGAGNALRERLAGVLAGPTRSQFGSLVTVLDESEVASCPLPPWFRIADEKDIAFGAALARLSSMSDEGREDFVGDRLKLYLEENIA